MTDTLIFGGTTEGRVLAEYCAKEKINVFVSVATDYGAELLPESENICVLCGRMDESQIECFITEHGIKRVFDATHPYAVEVTRNITDACIKTGAVRYRVLRERDETDGNSIFVSSVREAAEYLDAHDGNALITTGSKELSVYTSVSGFSERLTVRILPSDGALKMCTDMGFLPHKVITEKGPFSVSDNAEHIRLSGAAYLVTKDSGKTGGFPEKAEAAKQCGASLIVIRRPDEDGITVSAAQDILSEE